MWNGDEVRERFEEWRSEMDGLLNGAEMCGNLIEINRERKKNTRDPDDTNRLTN